MFGVRPNIIVAPEVHKNNVGSTGSYMFSVIIM